MDRVENNVARRYIAADRIILKDVNEKEYDIVNMFSRARAIGRFLKRLVISAVLITAVSFWFYDKVDMNTENYVLFMTSLFMIFNSISGLCTAISSQTIGIIENYYILTEATVEGKVRGFKKRIVFSCDQGISDVPIQTGLVRYLRTKVGDGIVVVKRVTASGYTFKYLKEDEYYNISNKRKSKS